ncbi:uncharacterized protein IL334_007794 [Kwoniella shivajii]|uniref:Uncharacterized protein n=1 Tax=Kwoniella shivajii TaxID=564305 RepID=A0ABZ1D9M4_9TREE|nr:hypothetical protein IL334_007794 [Kwoniella shivajii]
MAPHPSVSPSFPTASPKPPAPDPNINPYSALSPDLSENTLGSRNGDDEITRLLGLRSSQKDLVIYSRRQLLNIGKNSRQFGPPPGMGSLDTWFGLRRQPESSLDVNGLPIDNRSYGGQMGRFSVKNSANAAMKLGGDEVRKERRNDEWRRSDNVRAPRDNSRRNYQREEDTSEPAWMDDAAPADPTVPEDPLVQFIPGEDMIAAHKRAMKARDVPRDVSIGWRGDGGLPAFFGSDPAIASTSAPAPPPGLKPKLFNAADYLTQAQEVENTVAQPTPPASAFSSRFQKFFNATPEHQQIEVSQPKEEAKDDRMAKLMGLLSTKTSLPPDPVYAVSEQMRQAPDPPFYGSSPPPSSHPNALLQQLYATNPQERPDPLQLLSQAQRQGFERPPHMSMPPQFARPPMYPQDEPEMGYPFARPFGPPPPGFMPPPPPFFQGPPRPPAGYPPNFTPQQQPRQYPLAPAQQDMLATLFAGLGPRN